MTAAPGDDDSFMFCPDEHRLVDGYLRAKVEGKSSDPASAAYFLDADVCSARPQDLVRAHAKAARVSTKEAGDGQQWFFFSPVRFLGNSTKKRSRTIAGTDEKERWHAEGRQKAVDGGGYVQKFSYHIKTGPKTVVKPGWVMAEYGFQNNREGDMVICKVYTSPWGSKKRKAADDLDEATPTTTRPRRETEEAQIQQAPEFQVEEELLHAPGFSGDRGLCECDMLNIDYDHSVPEVTKEEFEQYFAAFKEDIERGAAVPEMVHYGEESLPMPQIAQISDKKVDDYSFFSAEDDGMALDVPEGEDPSAYCDAAIQTVLGPLTDGEVIAALATGVKVDELIPDSPSTLFKHPAGASLGVLPCT